MPSFFARVRKSSSKHDIPKLARSQSASASAPPTLTTPSSPPPLPVSPPPPAGPSASAARGAARKSGAKAPPPALILTSTGPPQQSLHSLAQAERTQPVENVPERLANRKNRRLSRGLTALFTGKPQDDGVLLKSPTYPKTPLSATYTIDTDIRPPSGLGGWASEADLYSTSVTQSHDGHYPLSPVSPLAKQSSTGSRKRSPLNDRKSASNLKSPPPSSMRMGLSGHSTSALSYYSAISGHRSRSSSSISITSPTGSPAPRWIPRSSSDIGHSSTSSHSAPRHPQVNHPYFSRLPTTLLADSIFALLPKAELARIARVNRNFLLPVRMTLYRILELDLLHMSYLRVGACVTTLASSREIASLVRKFSCPLLASSFPIALKNMTGLQELMLKRYDQQVLDSTTFRLTTLAFTDPLAERDGAAFVAWISQSQPELQVLSLPATPSLPRPPSPSPTPSTHTTKTTATTTSALPLPRPLPPTVLPHLTHLSVSDMVAALLVPGRPVRHLALRIHTSLFDGLRPSELLTALSRSKAPIMHLELSLDPRVDARTHERILVAAGKHLPKLEILEVTWLLKPKELYKQLTFVLSLFPLLHTLRLRWDTLSLGKPPHDSEKEVSQLRSWARHAPMLRTVTFLSGSAWGIQKDKHDELDFVLQGPSCEAA